MGLTLRQAKKSSALMKKGATPEAAAKSVEARWDDFVAAYSGIYGLPTPSQADRESLEKLAAPKPQKKKRRRRQAKPAPPPKSKRPPGRPPKAKPPEPPPPPAPTVAEAASTPRGRGRQPSVSASEAEFRRSVDLVNAGLTLPEIYVALHPLTPGQVRNLLLQARIWALQNNVHMGRVATSPIRDEDGEPIVERKPLPDVSINSIAQNHPEGHWAWVVTRITDTYGDAAVAKYMGVPSGMINGWSLGGAVPSVQHRETLWRILVAAVAHSNGMDAYQMEDLHDHISSLMLANARTRT
ncbi:MAG: hypothetical protein IT477_10850 [Rhodanobacteraceae bacterium]|nr:hypothetical protein [Rhodanobacteraceae bacterium]